MFLGPISPSRAEIKKDLISITSRIRGNKFLKMWLALPVPGRGVFGRGLVRVSARRCSSLTEEEEEDVDINDRQHPPVR